MLKSIGLCFLVGGISFGAAVNSYAADAVSAPATPAVAAPVENKTGVSAENYDNMQKKLGDIGFAFTYKEQNLEIDVDQAKLLKNIPSLSADGAIVKVDEADIKSAPMSVSVYAVDVSFAVTIMTAVYAKNPTLDNLHATVFVKPADGSAKQPCFSFDYTRALYDKLDMNTTSTNDFIAKTPGFAFSPWCQKILDEESKAANATSSKK